jgi:hypothetical protein
VGLLTVNAPGAFEGAPLFFERLGKCISRPPNS